MKLFRLFPLLGFLLALLVSCGDNSAPVIALSSSIPQAEVSAPEMTSAPMVTSSVKPVPDPAPEITPETADPVIGTNSQQPDVPTPSHSEPEETRTPAATPNPTPEAEPSIAVAPSSTPIVTPSPVVSFVPIPTETVAPITQVTPVPVPSPSETPAPTPTPAPTLSTPVQTYSYPVAIAAGTREQRSDNAVIDYSNTADGYVMVQYTKPINVRLKAQVKGPKTTYTYDLTAQKWATFPLSEGNGDYTVAIYSNVSGTKYANVISVKFTATIKSEFEPFLYPNQYVDYVSAPNAIAKAKELTDSIEQPLEKVAAVYDYVVGALTYDKQKAATVKSGYLPVLDDVLAKKTGICFDYAALMTGMLRSQGVPCKLVVGYAGSAYHAWINVWTEESGWVDGAIFFDGKTWQRMDPTFASSGQRSDSIMQYIGDGSNYKEKYLY